MNNPLVTVNILSFNRRDELRHTLTKVFEQDYKNIEVIVADNASSDGSPEMVEKEFPQVNLVRLKKNIGIAGWNKGFEIAKGEYVLVLDDDAFPEKNTIDLCLGSMRNKAEVACIAINTLDINKKIRTKWLPSENVRECFWPVFVGCAAFFRKNYLDSEPMPKDYFIYQHELPVSADIYLNNYKIYFHHKIKAYHNFKSGNVYSQFSDKYLFRNNLKFISKYLPVYLAIMYWFQAVAFFFTRSIRRRWFKDYIEIVLTVKPFILNSKKISLDYFLMLRDKHYFNLPLISKLSR